MDTMALSISFNISKRRLMTCQSTSLKWVQKSTTRPHSGRSCTVSFPPFLLCRRHHIILTLNFFVPTVWLRTLFFPATELNSRSVMLWNVALNQDFGPRLPLVSWSWDPLFWCNLRGHSGTTDRAWREERLPANILLLLSTGLLYWLYWLSWSHSWEHLLALPSSSCHLSLFSCNLLPEKLGRISLKKSWSWLSKERTLPSF